MSDKEEPGAFDLLMPFVACQSQGGAYDDAAFVAAYSCATLDQALERLAALVRHGLTEAKVERYVPPALVSQLDLIAMKHGYSLVTKPYDDEWMHVTFLLASEPGRG